MFPKIGINMSKEDIGKLWTKQIETYPEILNIKTISELSTMISHLEKISKDSISVTSESHAGINNIIQNIPLSEQVDLVNIDFHHDNYHYYGAGIYNSSNWLRALKETRPNSNVRWIRREDSQIESLDGSFPYYNTVNMYEALEAYNYIFICFSPEWTPPHLRKDYNRLLNSLKGEIITI